MRPPPEFMERIRAEPKAPEHRLAYAEWLEKHGEASRAEFIRAEWALRTAALNPQQRLTLKKRVPQLLEAHAKEWAARLPGMSSKDLHYRRGFIEELVLPEKHLAEHGEALFAREPVHKLMVWVQDGKGLGSAAEQPWFAQVRWLKLMGKVDAGAKALSAATHAGKLDSLLIPGAGKHGISAVLNSERLGGLRTLSLTGSSVQLEDEAFQVFSEGRLQLERLLLSECLLLSEGIASLAEAEWLRPLKWLALNRNDLADEDVEALAESEVLENLEWLELARNELSPEGVCVLASPKALPRLKHLDVSEMWWDKSELGPLQKRFRSGLKV